jgi:hypothetical protein
MKTNATLLVLLLLATTSVFAQEAEPYEGPKADYSKGTLLRLFAGEEFKEAPVQDLRFYFGAVQFRALNTNFTLIGLMPPLYGARFATTREWPDAFTMTRTQIPMSGLALRRYQRSRNAELRRIERVSKPKAKIKVEAD